ncbi:MAG: SpoIIE family protein phosphatase [Oligoflexia bacterium]|nr:SpoIIE family protein phosphatase [Oligoflexia bacterium]
MRGIDRLFSIRTRVVALITGALVLCLTSYLLIGTSLIVEDKATYIYDYNHAHATAAVTALTKQLEGVVSNATMMGRLLGPGTDPAALKELFRERFAPMGVSTLVFLRGTGEELRASASYGETFDDEKLASELAKLGWNSEALARGELLIGHPFPGRIALGGGTRDASGVRIYYVCLLELQPGEARRDPRGFELYVVDPVGRIVVSRTSTVSVSPAREIDALARALWQGDFSSGLREYSIAGAPQLVSYEKIASGRLLVIRVIPKEVAFSAAKALVGRSIILGVSIFFLATGLTLALVRRITKRLTELAEATRKVSQGDFSVRVATRGSSGDESVALAKSFNAMADRIDTLMLETAEKARMEKELEMAQLLQSRFFPTTGFEHPNFRLAGAYAPASECAGDWWNFARIGDRLVIVLGDVMGHGVSSALVTAAAHGAFTLFMEDARGLGQLSLEELARRMNRAVLAAGHGQISMSLVACQLDLASGVLEILNLGHCTPLLSRDAGTEVLALGAPGSLLGLDSELKFSKNSVGLQAGDVLLWYTDGLFAPRLPDRQRLSTRSALKHLRERVAKSGLRPGEAVKEFLEHALGFFGPARHRPDDITLVVATVPERASFLMGRTAS